MTEQATEATESIPFARQCPFSPPEQYARMVEEEPVSRVRLPIGDEVWALTSHEHVQAALADRRFSSDNRLPAYPHFSMEKPGEQPIQTMINLDGADHNEARRRVISEYTAKRIKELRPTVQRIVDERVDALLEAGGPLDFVAEFAVQIPALVMCEQLGVPTEDHQFFLKQASVMVSITASEADRGEALNALMGYLMGLIAQKEENPGEDLISRQIAKNKEGGDHDPMQLMGLVFLLLVAGHETSANSMALGMALLLRHPDQLEKLRQDPSLTPNAMEEVLRYFTVSELALVRVATEDVEIGGRTIRAGEGVVALANAANHDPKVFPDPNTFDITRSTQGHLAFGYGPHQCLGASLARLEFEIVFDTLLARIPGMKLAVPEEELRFKGEEGVYGLYELPVTW